MMADDQLKLHGVWASPYSCRVKWALELKGIPYEYIEEDIMNKSELLLQYNPVHKKIPVLVHGDKPVCESMIIVEYIDQIWPHRYPLLPKDPYDRAFARFWVKFAEDKGSSIWTVFLTTGEEQEKAKRENIEMLRTIEDHAFIGVGDEKLFGGDEIGIVDIAFGVIAYWYGVIELVGFKLFEEREFPKLHAWANNFKQVHAIKQTLPDRNALSAVYTRARQNLLVLA